MTVVEARPETAGRGTTCEPLIARERRFFFSAVPSADLFSGMIDRPCPRDVSQTIPADSPAVVWPRQGSIAALPDR